MTAAARRALWCAGLILTFVLVAGAAAAQPASQAADGAGGASQAELAEIGAKLSNPVSDVWALFTEFDVYFSDGDVNQGDSQAGGRMLFQPILPTAVVGYKTKDWIAGAFPQYYFGFADSSDHNDVPRASYLNLLYFAFYNLPDAWQIGTNPTITYDDRAGTGDKWNVPLGLTVAKTTRVSGLPVKVQFGIEYPSSARTTSGSAPRSS